MNAPICAVCGHCVDRFSVLCGCSGTELLAECHGETQSIVITDEMLADMPSGVEICVLSAFNSGDLAVEQP